MSSMKVGGCKDAVGLSWVVLMEMTMLQRAPQQGHPIGPALYGLRVYWTLETNLGIVNWLCHRKFVS